MNLYCKSYRNWVPSKRTGSLCKIEFANKITCTYRVFVTNRSQKTIVRNIYSQVASGTIIQTDQQSAYKNLRNLLFNQDTVCHNYECENKISGVHIQGIEIF